ncbi:MAG: PQQ-dependent dehydrogenase, methanol/ethanol family [Acidobacteria bacterium]|nr:MAG: PQQ-dependent dehydrogenase, methanol/ethanol family [Acidobacteriota bacterium]
MRWRLSIVLVAVLALGSFLLAQVSPDRLLNAQKEPHNWLTYSGSYMSQRHSPLTQITTANVKDLELKWVFQARWLDYYQATPLVVDGIMYTTQGNDVVALDATTGKIFWIYPYTPADVRLCCGRITRGLAILGDTLFLAAADAHLIAIDAKTGRPIWNRIVASGFGYSMTVAPLVIKDKVIVGTAGGEYGIRGFIAAYDAATGMEAWRFNTVPSPEEPGHETWGGGWEHGGGSIWVTGSYDPETNLTFWGVGNPGPDYNAETRPGDNLYTCSVVALDADTGKLRWHYQFTPADEFDWDAVQIPVLADISWKGQPRKVMLWANRNGFLYVLDRRTGEFLQATPIAKQNWNAGFDNGRPIRSPSAMPSRDGVLIYPGNQGATNWFSPSYSPRTGLFYVNVWENTHHIFARADQEYREGSNYTAGRLSTNYPGRGIGAGMRAVQRPNLRKEEENFGAVRAFDPHTGQWRWEYKQTDLTDAGILTTATDLLFTGGREGYFFALDARNGSLLWKIQLGGPTQNGPISYAVNGRQYVAVSVSNSLFVFGLR